MNLNCNRFNSSANSYESGIHFEHLSYRILPTGTSFYCLSLLFYFDYLKVSSILSYLKYYLITVRIQRSNLSICRIIRDLFNKLSFDSTSTFDNLPFNNSISQANDRDSHFHHQQQSSSRTSQYFVFVADRCTFFLFTEELCVIFNSMPFEIVLA